MGPQRVSKMPDVKVDQPVRNLELEKLRNEGFNSAVDDEKLAKDLAGELELVHAAYLFWGSGKRALRKICLVVSSTPTSSNVAFTSSWKDVAYLLGLTFHEIGCIENMHSDCTEIVLMTYAANDINANIGKIIAALSKLKRYDAIAEAKDDLKDVAELARREHNLRIEEEPNQNSCLRPTGWSHLKSQLPVTLRRCTDLLMFDETISNINSQRVEENLQQATVFNRRQHVRKKCSKLVMLTFAKDGEETAYKVATQLRKCRGQHLPIGVLILEENYDVVEANPVNFITKVFPKMDYIIPILTPQYLECKSVDKTPSNDENTWSVIDTRYVKMIYTLMGNYYLGNVCKNDKFRSIIPDNYVSSVLNDSRMKIDPVLQAYVTESRVEDLAKRILNKK